MSEEIPKAPIIMRAYNLIRNKITPTQNIIFVILESLIIGGAISGVLYFYLESSMILASLPLISLLLIIVARFVSIQPDKKFKEQYVMNVGFKSLLILIVLSVIPFAGYYYFKTLTQELQIIPVILLLYLATVYGRSRKYLGERDYYTDSYSNASQQWYMASVALEKAVSYADSDKGYRAYYWASRAQSLYEEIVETEERVALREAASALSAGCEFLSVSIFTQDTESYSYYSAAQESFERASEFFLQRVCDSCGRRKPLDQCQRVVRDNQKYVYCNTCRKAEASSSSTSKSSDTTGRKSSQRSQNKRQSSSQTGSSQNRQRSTTTNSSRSSSNTSSSSGSSSRSNTDNKSSKKSRGRDKSDRISKEEALEVLGLEEPITDSSEIHGAFRKNVKNSHPDTGGSEEEFKKVKKAREVLLDEV